MLNADIPHIICSSSAPWCGWTMLGLLLSAVIGEWSQPGVLSQSFASLIVRNERTYNESPVTFIGQLCISLFRIGTVGMALLLCEFADSGFPYAAFWVVCGLCVAVMMVKMLINSLLDYTFMLTRRFGAPYEHYGNLFTLVAVVLYPIMLVLLQFHSPVVARWALGIVAALFCVLWFYRCIRTYCRSLPEMIYIILYICTLEILPFAGLAYISAKMIAIL